MTLTVKQYLEVSSEVEDLLTQKNALREVLIQENAAYKVGALLQNSDRNIKAVYQRPEDIFVSEDGTVSIPYHILQLLKPNGTPGKKVRVNHFSLQAKWKLSAFNDQSKHLRRKAAIAEQMTELQSELKQVVNDLKLSLNMFPLGSTLMSGDTGDQVRYLGVSKIEFTDGVAVPSEHKCVYLRGPGDEVTLPTPYSQWHVV